LIYRKKVIAGFNGEQEMKKERQKLFYPSASTGSSINPYLHPGHHFRNHIPLSYRIKKTE
jgi:hypothetical protein